MLYRRGGKITYLSGYASEKKGPRQASQRGESVPEKMGEVCRGQAAAADWGRALRGLGSGASGDYSPMSRVHYTLCQPLRSSIFLFPAYTHGNTKKLCHALTIFSDDPSDHLSVDVHVAPHEALAPLDAVAAPHERALPEHLPARWHGAVTGSSHPSGHRRRSKSLIADHSRVDVERALCGPLRVLVLLVLLLVREGGARSSLPGVFPRRVVGHVVGVHLLVENRGHAARAVVRLLQLLCRDPKVRQLIYCREGAALQSASTDHALSFAGGAGPCRRRGGVCAPCVCFFCLAGPDNRSDADNTNSRRAACSC